MNYFDACLNSPYRNCDPRLKITRSVNFVALGLLFARWRKVNLLSPDDIVLKGRVGQVGLVKQIESGDPGCFPVITSVPTDAFAYPAMDFWRFIEQKEKEDLKKLETLRSEIDAIRSNPKYKKNGKGGFGKVDLTYLEEARDQLLVRLNETSKIKHFLDVKPLSDAKSQTPEKVVARIY